MSDADENTDMNTIDGPTSPLEDAEWMTHSATQTQDLGEALGRCLEAGDLVSFRGDLGAGKTCMIQGVCRGLEVEGQVNSPTFILINEYLGGGASPIAIYHFDLYRLGGPDELEDLGALEYFYGDGVCLVEWPERAGNLLPPRRYEIELEYLGDTQRRITLRTFPAKGTTPGRPTP
jgi:tRNA threonylcarbamoyladenosine biosynthesis protein TsaE